MKKSFVSLVAAIVLAVPVMAEELKVKVDPSADKISGKFKLMHIVDGAYSGTSQAKNDNKFDTSTGSAALLNVKYKTKSVNNISAVFNHFTLADTGLTDNDAATAGDEKAAKGMFINYPSNGTSTFSILGEAYVNYKTKADNAKIGRQLWKTPLTTIKFSTMPTFFQGASYERKIGKEITFHAANMTKMAFGARAFADATLIGEGTNTAGAYAPTATTAIGQGQFISMSQAGGYANDDSSDMTAVGLTYKKGKKLTVRAWNYIINDMANNLYADAEYKHGFNKTTKLIVGVQHLSQSYDDTGITDGNTTSSFNLSGMKLALVGKMGERKYKIGVAMNESSGDTFVNVWGADPAYTSTIFSRNQFRKNVSAVKYTVMMTLIKGLKLVVGHANYGKSETSHSVFGTAANDAVETDIVLVYEPNKKWMVKLFNAQRKSEYDDVTTHTFDHTQNHTRLMAHYKF